ncbi:hypothetical protein OCEANICA350_10642 [Oceanicaulis sp. 350]|nr:hypothetical protein OCEANICA350_10642 [Oceanicaulis sp. 350]
MRVSRQCGSRLCHRSDLARERRYGDDLGLIGPGARTDLPDSVRLAYEFSACYQPARFTGEGLEPSLRKQHLGSATPAGMSAKQNLKRDRHVRRS